MVHLILYECILNDFLFFFDDVCESNKKVAIVGLLSA